MSALFSTLDEDEKSHLECAIMTLLGQMVLAMAAIALLFLSGLTVDQIESLMVGAAVPWFLFWAIFCNVTHRIIVKVVDDR